MQSPAFLPRFDQALAQLPSHGLLKGFVSVLGASHQVSDLFIDVHFQRFHHGLRKFMQTTKTRRLQSLPW
jgi:hypothetical protein